MGCSVVHRHGLVDRTSCRRGTVMSPWARDGSCRLRWWSGGVFGGGDVVCWGVDDVGGGGDGVVCGSGGAGGSGGGVVFRVKDGDGCGCSGG